MSMEPVIAEVAERISAMRDLCDFTVEEMAETLDITPAEYKEYEAGKRDFSFTFLYKCADKFGIDMIELLTGENPHLSECTVVRGGNGLPIKRRAGFEYYHLAAAFKNKLSEPFIVIAPYDASNADAPLATSTHVGQEFDLVLSGSLRFVHDGRETVLEAGDSVYYNSGKPHGMAAVSEGGCRFLAIVMKGSQ